MAEIAKKVKKFKENESDMEKCNYFFTSIQ